MRISLPNLISLSPFCNFILFFSFLCICHVDSYLRSVLLLMSVRSCAEFKKKKKNSYE